mgnify:CR=1 FL=1
MGVVSAAGIAREVLESREAAQAQVAEAQAQGVKAKPVIVGPVTYLWLGKAKDDSDKLALLCSLLDGQSAVRDGLHIRVTPGPVSPGGPRLLVGGGSIAAAEARKRSR